MGARAWVVPKSANIGDDVVICVGSYGFFAAARIKSPPKPKADWVNRYGAGLDSIRLIKPPISLAIVRRHIPKLEWARFPRSYTSPPPKVAAQIRNLINKRQKVGIPDLDYETIAEANIEELRKVALLGARRSTTRKERSVSYRVRSLAIKRYVLLRADGHCEGCNKPAPFHKADGEPYLEPHHTTRLADEGPDHPAKVIALCPNCHKRAHHAKDAKAFNGRLKGTLAILES